MRTLKALSWLLGYPDAEMRGVLPELIAMIDADEALTTPRRSDLHRLVGALEASDEIDAQERYVELFDRSRRNSLYLFEHVHGVSRDRGMAMVNLRELYAAAGLESDTEELPDYLPMYLEYLSVLPQERAVQGLRDVGRILQAIHARLAEQHSIYAAAFAGLLQLAGLEPDTACVEGPEDDSPEGIDRAWEETAVAFGPQNDPTRPDGCGRVAGMLERMHAADTAAKRAETRR
jgi:nitrate reductase delta subunit